MTHDNQSDHDLLIRLDEKVSQLVQKFDASFLQLNGKAEDNTRRIKNLENWRAYVIGIAVGAGAIAGFLAGLLK